MADIPHPFSEIAGFEWDNWNLDKNWLKHGVTRYESEQIFFNQPLLVSNDEKHSQDEARFNALGKTDTERLLSVAFTVRSQLIRIISARGMNGKEKRVYEDAKEDSEI